MTSQIESQPRDGVEKRRTERHANNIDLLYDMVRSIDHQLRELRQSHDATVLLLRDHTVQEDAIIKKLMNAFPNEDPEKHRKHHDAELRYFERKTRVQDAIIEKSLAGLVWMILVGIGTAVWFYIKSLLHLT